MCKHVEKLLNAQRDILPNSALVAVTPVVAATRESIRLGADDATAAAAELVGVGERAALRIGDPDPVEQFDTAGARLGLAQSEVGDLFAALTLLNLPSGDVYIDQQVCRGKDERSARTDSYNQSRRAGTALLFGCSQAFGIEEVLEFPRMHVPEYRIFGELRSELSL